MKTLPPVNSVFKVGYPAVVSEFEVHAKLLVKLQELGIDARANVTTPAKFDGSRKCVCTFDIVIFENKKPTMIVEVKNGTVRNRNGVESTRQGRRYRFFGLPVTFVYGMQDVDLFLASFAGVPISS